MASRLLFELTITKRVYLPTDSLFDKFSLCISEMNPEKAHSILEQAIEKFMIDSDADLRLVKIYTTHFILMLYELMEEHSDVGKHKETESFPGQQLSSAESLGELKTCLDAVSQECMMRLFPSMLYRHHLLLQKAALMIRQNYHQKLSQNAVAGSVYLSPSYFSKVFKEAFGCTFNQYLNTVRITKAKELLRYSSVSIESIPAMVGFENRSYFGKIFKQLTGSTPKQYRNTSCN